MRTILVIGIGSGDPEQVTVQAIRALNRADAFFVMDKGAAKAELVRLRREIVARYREPGRPYRFIEAEDPRRDPAASYKPGVAAWHAARAAAWERLIRDELEEEGCGAFLVWGDPALYDSTLRVLDAVRARGSVPFRHEAIPGISAPQALAARHGTVLNQVGEALIVTTGRKLAEEGLPAAVETGATVVVMLDGDAAFLRFAGRTDLEVVWGAYLGTLDELLVRGRLADVADRIAAARAEARRRKGWIMDTCLLRRTDPTG